MTHGGMADSGSDLPAQLVELLGTECVLSSDRVREYAIGPFAPLGVAKPNDVEGVRAVLQWAHRNGVAVYPVGGRTLNHLGNLPTRPGIALDLNGLNEMIDFQPADLTVRVQAGMTVAQLDSELAQDGKYVPLAPPLARQATIGGTLATGISGPLRSAYGLPRDWLIGISVVGADGTPSKSGGQVVKNVTGYDLNRLYTGSLGTLAVITEATFKITPAPTAWAAIAAAFDTSQSALDAARNLLAQAYAPQALHILSPEAARRLGNANVLSGHGPVAIALIAGRPASVRRRIEDTTLAWLGATNTLQIAGQEAVGLAEALADLAVNPTDPPSVCVRLNTPPSSLEQLMTMDNQDIAGVSPEFVADAGFGGGRLMWWDAFSCGDVVQIADRLRNIQATAIRLGGDAVVETCPLGSKELIDVWGPEPSGMEIMRRIKNQFDPEGVLNPGRFIGGL